MADLNYVVSSLPDYVNANKELILANLMLKGGTRERNISIQTGVKKNALVTALDVEPTIQDGSACGFSAAGSATLSGRTIAAALLKVNMEICPKTLLGKYPEYLVNVGAGKETLPFEQWFVEGLIAETVKQTEKLLWQGDKSGSSAPDNLLDGWRTIAQADGTAVTLNTGTGVLSDLQLMVSSMSNDVLDREDAVIYVSPAVYRALLADVASQNLYHYMVNPESKEMYIPGTSVKAVSTPGLSGATTYNAIGTFEKNVVYGCDVDSDVSDVDIWFSKDNDVFRANVQWVAGAQFALVGTNVTYGTVTI